MLSPREGKRPQPPCVQPSRTHSHLAATNSALSQAARGSRALPESFALRHGGSPNASGGDVDTLHAMRASSRRSPCSSSPSPLSLVPASTAVPVSALQAKPLTLAEAREALEQVLDAMHEKHERLVERFYVLRRTQRQVGLNSIIQVRARPDCEPPARRHRACRVVTSIGSLLVERAVLARVQHVDRAQDGLHCVAKFYTSRPAFLKEKEIFERADIRPPLASVVLTRGAGVTSASHSGFHFPPVIVMERGEVRPCVPTPRLCLAHLIPPVPQPLLLRSAVATAEPSVRAHRCMLFYSSRSALERADGASHA